MKKNIKPTLQVLENCIVFIRPINIGDIHKLFQRFLFQKRVYMNAIYDSFSNTSTSWLQTRQPTRKHQNSNSFDMTNTCLKEQKCLPWCTGVHNGQRKWEHEAVSRVGRVGKEGGTRDRGTQAGQPGDQPDRRLTHWQVCAGWLEPGQHLRKPIIVPCLVPSQSVFHNVRESLHDRHPDPVLFSLVFSLQTL